MSDRRPLLGRYSSDAGLIRPGPTLSQDTRPRAVSYTQPMSTLPAHDEADEYSDQFEDASTPEPPSSPSTVSVATPSPVIRALPLPRVDRAASLAPHLLRNQRSSSYITLDRPRAHSFVQNELVSHPFRTHSPATRSPASDNQLGDIVDLYDSLPSLSIEAQSAYSFPPKPLPRARQVSEVPTDSSTQPDSTRRGIPTLIAPNSMRSSAFTDSD